MLENSQAMPSRVYMAKAAQEARQYQETAVEPVKTSPISVRLDECEYAFTELSSAVHRLANRIECVLAPVCVDQPVNNSGMVRPPQSKVYIQLDCQQAQILELTMFVNGLVERCEIW